MLGKFADYSLIESFTYLLNDTDFFVFFSSLTDKEEVLSMSVIDLATTLASKTESSREYFSTTDQSFSSSDDKSDF